MALPKMIRACADEKAFIGFNGIESFQRTFGRKETIAQLLEDPVRAEANTYYEKNQGTGITKDDVDAFIARWGERYDAWFVRKTYTKVFPFENNLRDYKGTPVPQGKGPFRGNVYGDVIDPEELYIRTHGILNYMIRYKPRQSLEELMENKLIAEHQQAYIRKLEYDGLLI
jgi:hypothetical protein